MAYNCIYSGGAIFNPDPGWPCPSDIDGQELVDEFESSTDVNVIEPWPTEFPQLPLLILGGLVLVLAANGSNGSKRGRNESV